MSNLYKPKSLKVGFIILCPNLNIGHLKNTISSTEVHFPEAKVVVVLPDNCKKEDLTSTSKKAYKGGKTTASMINIGMKHAPCNEWNIILLSKGWFTNRIDIKYSYFVESEKDILFPIVNRNLTIADADINGLMIHKKTFEDIGDFPDINSLELSKVFWASKALIKGYKFKGVVGAKPF